MRLPEMDQLEQEYLKQKIRCFTLLNGYLSMGMILIITYVIYQVVKSIV